MGGGRSSDKYPAGLCAFSRRAAGVLMDRKVLGIIMLLCLATVAQPALAAEDSVNRGASKVGGGVREVGKSAGHYGKKAGHAAKGAAKDTGKAAGKALNDIGRGLRKAFR